MELEFYTIGHSTRPVQEFAAMLQEANVDQVVDVRSFPRSRTNPDYNLEILPTHLAPFNIGYEHIPDLGGRRKKSKEVPADVNAWWHNQSFHNYADYALSEPFRNGLARLITLAQEGRCALMCSEAVWWRCHRRIITDYLIHDGRKVLHLMGPGREQAASLTPTAIDDGHNRLLYPVPSEAK